MAVTEPTEFEPSGETTFERVRTFLEEYGELMVRFDSGVEAELHKHNVDFSTPPLIKVETGDAVHWFDAEKIESCWIHYSYVE